MSNDPIVVISGLVILKSPKSSLYILHTLQPAMTARWPKGQIDFINPDIRKDKDLLSVHLGVGMEKSLYMCEVSKQINQICISAHPLSCKLSFKTSQTWAKRGGEDILNHLAPCVLDQWSCRTIDQKFVMTPPYPRSLCPNLRSPKVILGHLRSC